MVEFGREFEISFKFSNRLYLYATPHNILPEINRRYVVEVHTWLISPEGGGNKTEKGSPQSTAEFNLSSPTQGITNFSIYKSYQLEFQYLVLNWYIYVALNTWI